MSNRISHDGAAHRQRIDVSNDSVSQVPSRQSGLRTIRDTRLAELPTKPAGPANFRATLGDLMARVERNDSALPGVVVWDTRSVEVPPGEHKQLIVRGVDHETALAIVTRYQDGRHLCTLSCYPSSSAKQQLEAMQNDLCCHASADATARQAIFVVTPAYSVRQQNGRYVLEVTSPDQIQVLEKALKAKLPSAQFNILPFHLERMRGKPIGLILDIPAQAGRPVRYRHPSGKGEF